MEVDSGKDGGAMSRATGAPPASYAGGTAPGSARAESASAVGGARAVSLVGGSPRGDAWDPWAVDEQGNWADPDPASAPESAP
eukprot:4186455-Lingulodinium_polyedra.AAC.1